MATPYIPYRLDGKVALVTGSGRGIGKAMAVELGRLGAKVVVNYANSAESAEETVAVIKALGSDAVAFKADVRQVPQTVKLFDDAVAEKPPSVFDGYLHCREAWDQIKYGLLPPNNDAAFAKLKRINMRFHLA